jgi:uncharacterized phage protein gp47/JayE
MALQLPDFDALRERYLQEVRNQQPLAAVGADSDHFVRASGVAAAIESLHHHVWWLARQLFPDTSDADILDRQASLYGLARKPASVASGSVTITGTAGTAVSAGIVLQAASGQQYEVTQDAAVGGGGTVDVAAWALAAGTAGNLAPAAALSITPPIAGLSAAVVVTMDGGEEAETDEALRARVLEIMRNAPAGGNAADYRRWALEVAGVARAFVYAGRRGLGTVDVAIMAPSGLPSAGLISTVDDYVQARRPVTADVLVLQPELVTVDVTATVILSGATLADAQAAAAVAIQAYVDTLAPGDTLYRSRLIAAIQDVPGVVTVSLTTPAADVTTSISPPDLELASLGTVTLAV